MAAPGVCKVMTRNVTRTARAVMTPSEQAVRRHADYLSDRGLSRYTITRRKQALGRLAKALPGPLLDATPEQLREWRHALSSEHRNGQRPLTNSAVACYLSHIKGFFRWAADEGIIPANPAITVPVPKLPRRFPRPIPEADLMHALSLTTHKMPVRLMLVLGGWCGLRIGEVAGLRVEDVRLHDTPPVVIVSAESAKGSKERIVELSPFVVRELELARLPLSGYVFTDANGDPLTAWFASRIANAHLKGSGTKSKFHATRHRFATLLYAETKDLRLVGEMLGHAPGSAHTANYAAFSRTGATAAVAALPVPDEVNAIPAPALREEAS